MRAGNSMRAQFPVSKMLIGLQRLHPSNRTTSLARSTTLLFCPNRLSMKMATHTPMRHLATTQFQELPAEAMVEEESVPGYRPSDFYPVKLGEVFNRRYQVVTKLGCGVGSTAWLCRDLQTNRYLSLKVCTINRKNAIANQADNEATISQYVKSVGAEHPGINYMRLVLDDFTVEGPNGAHRCLLFNPLGMTLLDLRNLTPEKALKKRHLQQSLQLVLLALDLLHQAGVVHTDVSPNNVLLSIRRPGVWERVEQAEKSSPVPRKTLPDRTIYLSQSVPLVDGVAVLTDFGTAKMGQPQERFRGDVMPDIYRAPEVILGMEWDCKIDIWSVGVMIWDLFQGGPLFFACKNGMLNDEQHLAEMVSLMGPPPAEFLKRSEKCRQYWDENGNWIASTPIPEQSFEVREHRLEGEDHRLFVAFCRKVLRWLPEERPRADDLIGDEFLTQHIRERERAQREMENVNQ